MFTTIFLLPYGHWNPFTYIQISLNDFMVLLNASTYVHFILNTLYLSFYQKGCKTWHGLLRAFAALEIVTFACGMLNVLPSCIIQLFILCIDLTWCLVSSSHLALVIPDVWAYIACCYTYLYISAIPQLNILSFFLCILPVA